MFMGRITLTLIAGYATGWITRSCLKFEQRSSFTNFGEGSLCVYGDRKRWLALVPDPGDMPPPHRRRRPPRPRRASPGLTALTPASFNLPLGFHPVVVPFPSSLLCRSRSAEWRSPGLQCSLPGRRCVPSWRQAGQLAQLPVSLQRR
jgi:hypothetical protein